MSKTRAARADRFPRSFSPSRRRSLARDESGATLVEYALVLALVACGALLAVDVLHSGKSFDGVTAALNGGEEHATPGRPSAATPLAAAESYLQGVHVSLPTLVGLVALPALCLAWGLYYRLRRHVPVAEEEPVELAAGEPALPDRLFSKRQALLRLFTDNLAALLERDLLVKHLMSARLECIDPGEHLTDVRRRMKEKRIRHLVVCSGDGRLQGILSDRDVHARSGKTVADIMTRDPLTVAPGAPVNPAITLMIQRSISCLPVVEDGRVRGILTTTDLLLALQCNLQLLQRVAGMLRHDGAEGPAAECEERGEPVGAA